MSSGQYCLIRDLGLVKGGKGLRHHEVVLTLSWRGIISFVMSVVREAIRATESVSEAAEPPQSRPSTVGD